MRVIHHGVEISPSKEGVIYGGIENSVLRLAKNLNKNSIHPQIVSNDKKYRETGSATNNFHKHYADFHFTNVNGDYAGYRYSAEFLIKNSIEIKSLSRDMEIDVLHGHSGLAKLLTATSLPGLYSGLPSVHTFYCPLKNNLRNKFFVNLFSKNVSKFIAISENVEQSLLELGVSEHKIEIIHPIIDFESYNISQTININDELDCSVDLDEGFNILYLGNLSDTKCINEILDSLGELKKEHSEFHFLSGPEITEEADMELSTSNNKKRKRIRKKIKQNGLENHIIDLGPISDVPKYMNYVDVVLAPFKHTYHVADYPLTILEAQACGTPVISSSAGGISEIINDGETGILVDPNNPTEIKEGLLELMNNNKKLEEIGNKSYREVRKKLNEKKIINKTISIYNEVN